MPPWSADRNIEKLYIIGKGRNKHKTPRSASERVLAPGRSAGHGQFFKSPIWTNISSFAKPPFGSLRIAFSQTLVWISRTSDPQHSRNCQGELANRYQLGSHVFLRIWRYVLLLVVCPLLGHSWKLPDGVRTNGVVAEVSQFPLMNFHGKMWAKCDNIYHHVARYDKMWQVVAKCGNACALKTKYDNI